MKADLRVVLVGDRLVELSAPPPLSAKLCEGPLGPQLVIVSSAASLLEGDELSISIELSESASLEVRSAGAQLAFPCTGPGGSRLVVDVHVGDGCTLWWRPEPLVACAGCRHVSRTDVALAPNARALWLDELVLGRSGEPIDEVDVVTSTRVERGGVPIVLDGLRTRAPGALGPAGIGPNRYVATMVDLGTGRLDPGSSMELASGDLMQRVLAPDTRRRVGVEVFGEVP